MAEARANGFDLQVGIERFLAASTPIHTITRIVYKPALTMTFTGEDLDLPLTKEWTEYHLTPRGWEQGSKKLDFGKINHKEPPPTGFKPIDGPKKSPIITLR